MAETDSTNSQEKRREINPKTAFYVGTLVAIFGGILLFSIPELSVDPLRLFTDLDFFLQWLSKTLIIIFIVIVTMFISEGISRDYYKKKVHGLYQDNLSDFKIALEEIEGIAKYITDYIIWLIPRENVKNRKKYLLSIGMNSMEAEYISKYCGLNDVEDLSKGAVSKKDENGNPIYISKISQDMVEGVKHALSGKVDVKDTDSSKYLFYDDDEEFRASTLDRCQIIDKRIKRITLYKRLRKIAWTVVIGAIWTMFIFEKAAEGLGGVQVFMNLASRIYGMIGGFITGWATSSEVVRQLSNKLSSKTVVLKQFKSDYDDRTFIPKSYEQKAKEEYEIEHMGKEEDHEIEIVETNEQRERDIAPIGC